MSDIYSAWDVREKDFPHEGSPAEKLAFCVRYAILAPSTYNTQPWVFRISGNTLSLYADRRLALPVIDPDDREMGLSCAAALFALRLAIRHFGYAELTELMPDSTDPDLLARVKLGEKTVADAKDKDLFAAITRRHTNRGAFLDKQIPEESLRELKAAAAEEGAWIHFASPAERRVLISMIAEGDMIQSGRKNFRRELAAWLDPRRSKSGDGLPNYAQSFTDIMNTLSPLAVRRYETQGKKVVTDEELGEDSTAIAILGSKSGGVVEQLHAGQAMMRVLLRAEHLGLAVCPLNQPCEVPELRLRLHDEIDHAGRAHAIFRIGYSGKPSITPRRPLVSFLEFEGKQPAFLQDNEKKPKWRWLPNFLAKRA